jgi:hypothetical protein
MAALSRRSVMKSWYFETTIANDRPCADAEPWMTALTFDGVDDVAHRDGSLSSQRRGQRPGRGHELGGRHDAIDEANPLSFGCGNGLAGEDDLHRLPLADEPRQPLCSGVARKEPQGD